MQTTNQTSELMTEDTQATRVLAESGPGYFDIPREILRQGFECGRHGLSLDLTPFPAVMDGYQGCGSGWVEFDPDGTPLRMRYAGDPDDQGEDSQNAMSGSAGRIPPVVLPNGNIRLYGNFSCCSFCLF